MENNRDEMTLPGIVRRSAHDFKDRPALIAKGPQGDRVITFAELRIQVESLARGLIAHGFKEGSKCAILGPNSPEWAIAFMAISWAGGACVPIDTQLSKKEILHLISDAEADTVFADPEFLDCLLDITGNFPKSGLVIALTLDNKEIPRDGIPFEELIREGQEAPGALPQRVPEDPAAIIYTSGTTGSPKGVILTHANIVSDISACYQVLKCKQEHFLSILPLHHSFELTVGLFLPVYSGSSITFVQDQMCGSILEELRSSRASVILGCPLIFQRMLKEVHEAIQGEPAVQKATHILLKAVKVGEKFGISGLADFFFKDVRKAVGIDSLRFMLACGSPVNPKIPREFRWLGIKMLQGYGLSEAGPALTFNPVDRPVDESIGKTLSGVEVRIIGPDSTGVGELAFKGPMIMKGYHRAPEATREVLDSEGWLKTGDLGYQDEKGYLYLLGRAGNIIRTSQGDNIYPEEIETEINLRPFVRESLVYGYQKGNGKEVRAAIVPDYEAIEEHSLGRQLSDEYVHRLISRMLKKANKTLPPFKKVGSFTLLDKELPRNSAGKIMRRVFMELPPAE
ncbi:MAG: hypothetical protein AVO38_16175 [delta proteobacterium ML8_D]|nr:MAG: hypothetical protein AVO38_16175 [delta proteobacterium ML8_D]